MKKTRPYRFMHLPVPKCGGRSTAAGVVIALSCALFQSGCTTYRPLDQGSKVPWARALSAQSGPIDGDRYRVGEGDSLSRIAARYDVRLSTLATSNNIEAPYTLYPGEVLRIPADAPLPAKRPAIIQTALPAAEPAVNEETAWNRSAEPVVDQEGRRYVVEPGESLARIAYRNDLTLGELVAANEIEPPYRIKPGQTLFIPLTESARVEQGGTGQGGDGAASSLLPPPPLSEEGFLWPVNGELIGSFEQNRTGGRSGGVNIAARKGTPVLAADSGIVAYAGEALSGYGRMIMLRHGEGYVTLYAHNDAILVNEGDVVDRGQTIAEVGDSGDVDRSQLHFELRKGTAPLDPTKVLAGLPGRRIGGL
ncbi:MAG: peptidoglycan DD-metalloendopeptidase family protein [Geminicoccaceae bacterium]